MSPGVILVVLLGFACGALLRWWSTASASLGRRRALVRESWRLVDVELHRRHDLIPDVVRAVSGHLPQERATSDAVLRARAAACGGGRSPAERSSRERALTRELGRLFGAAERCPQLRLDDSYVALQRELAETQDRITAGRRRYNATVDALDAALAAFPTRLVARAIRVGAADRFEADTALEVRSSGRAARVSHPGPG